MEATRDSTTPWPATPPWPAEAGVSGQLAQAGQHAALSAAWELERIGELLVREAQDDALFVRTAGLRVRALAGALMSSVGAVTAGDVESAHEIVFGAPLDLPESPAR